MTILCIATYFKGEAFLRECRRQGCTVLLLTAETHASAAWPHDAIAEMHTIARGASDADIRRLVSSVARRHRIGRGAIVVILSDGWDRGEPEVLAVEMARLQRSAYRVIWLNPLKSHEGYEPLARGMAAALPHTDHFLAGSSLRSLEELAALLEGGIT